MKPIPAETSAESPRPSSDQPPEPDCAESTANRRANEANAKFSELDRSFFAFASYNAGPGKIARMRKAAEKRGLDPDVWFNNVELVTAEKIGIETTKYVRNIFKYYVAYKLMLDIQDEQKKARQAVQQGG